LYRIHDATARRGEDALFGLAEAGEIARRGEFL
jgi:hypothetical protein